jgi:hypothetical protein
MLSMASDSRSEEKRLVRGVGEGVVTLRRDRKRWRRNRTIHLLDASYTYLVQHPFHRLRLRVTWIAIAASDKHIPCRYNGG